MLKRYITKLGIMLALSMLLLFAFVGIFSLVMKPVYYWTPPKDNNKYNETLRVVGDINYAPMTFVDHNGNYAGYDVELLYLLGEKLEMNIELDLLSCKESVDRFKAGDYDLMVSITQRADVKDEYVYSIPLFSESYVAFSRSGETCRLIELADSKIAFLSGDFLNDRIISYYNIPEENVIKKETLAEAFEMLKNGECSCVIAPETVGQQILEQNNFTSLYATDTVILNSMHYFATLGNNDLLSRVNVALLELDAEGKTRELYDYWMVDYVSDSSVMNIMLENIPQIIIFFAIIVVGFSVIGIYFDDRQNAEIKRTSKILEHERSMYRDSLMFNCDYALTVNVTDNVLHTIHKLGSLAPYGFEDDVPYDELIERFLEEAEPFTVAGIDNFHSTEKYSQAFKNGRRIIEFEYYIQKTDSYIKEIVLLSKEQDTGKLFAFIVARDLTERRREELKTRRSLSRLAETASEVGKGNLDVEIDETLTGEVGILARSFQKTADQLKIYINSIKDLASVDSMTGMANRTSYVGTIADIDVKLIEESGFRFSVVMMDLNDLKKINDLHGHNAGDNYINDAAEIIKSVFGIDNTLLFRTGGDEFVAILFDKSAADMALLCSEFEDKIAEHNAINSEIPYKISIAYGYAIYNREKDGSYMDTYNRADIEMYRHKNKLKAMN